MSRTLRPALLVAALLASVWLLMPVPAAAQTGTDAKPVAGPTATRAQVRAINRAADGKTVIALKVVTEAKLPFTTLTLLVPDPSLVRDFAVGDEVFFTATRHAGQNSLLSLKKTAPCVRFQPCKQHE
ncbi:MAG: hypothetical protein Q8K71_04535 [Polaromonas sp.]|nr:hypothetical protein [Polaromonas sp.]MDP3753775.1 hypothetical protein [Polaromonas sp.]